MVNGVQFWAGVCIFSSREEHFQEMNICCGISGRVRIWIGCLKLSPGVMRADQGSNWEGSRENMNCLHSLVGAYVMEREDSRPLWCPLCITSAFQLHPMLESGMKHHGVPEARPHKLCSQPPGQHQDTGTDRGRYFSIQRVIILWVFHRLLARV